MEQQRQRNGKPRTGPGRTTNVECLVLLSLYSPAAPRSSSELAFCTIFITGKQVYSFTAAWVNGLTENQKTVKLYRQLSGKPVCCSYG